MAFTIRCDVEACGAEIQSGSGQPALFQKQRVYCPSCAAWVEQVEAQLRKEMQQFAVEGVDRINARRVELMAQMMPVGRGGSGEGRSEYPMVGNG